MQLDRAAALPLIVHDPYFSIWCGADALNAADPIHWSGAPQSLRGYIEVDGVPYCFMGAPGQVRTIPQTGLDVTPTATTYTFENEAVALTVTFTSPLLPEDPALMSRPCSYIRVAAQPKAGGSLQVSLVAGANIVRHTPGRLVGGSYTTDTFRYACMGKAAQHPLGNSGDNLTIDWGTLYLAGAGDGARFAFEPENERLCAVQPLSADGEAVFIVAYDDVASIHYFGSFCKGYWTRRWPTILAAIGGAFADMPDTLARCAALDTRMLDAAAPDGEDYALLCAMSLRHTVAAHKLIADEDGQLILLSKENDSNGCIGTVDVTYPSAPLFLLENPELVAALLRPVFRFAACPVWTYDFAPHDVGRYPYADGQVYGLRASATEYDGADGSIYPPFWQYPASSDMYDIRYQMPVEECGNMLILTAAVCRAAGSADFAMPYMQLLTLWSGYLRRFGADPGEQLCTDDFAGHLAHNVNLSAKAILGIEALAQIHRLAGNAAEADALHAEAKAMADSWQARAGENGVFRLAFDRPGSWSLKYNLVWDDLFGSQLFDAAAVQAELASYPARANRYGVPLDDRASYTKSDWILWCAAMAKDEALRTALIAPVAAYLRESTTRYPFGDWYDTVSGRYVHFKGRSVQGGIYMPTLVRRGL